MTTPHQAPPAGGSASAPTSPTLRSMWRGGRLIALLGLIVVAIAAITTLLGPDPRQERFLDPDDTSLRGSKALAELLRARGVTVDRVDSVEKARALGGDRLLFASDTLYLATDDLTDLPGDRLLVGAFDLKQLAPGVEPAPEVARERSRAPECALPAAAAAGSAFIGGVAFEVPPGGTGCYPSREGWTLVTHAAPTGTTTVVGSGSFMTNLRLDEDGNAALAINLLDTGKPVTWLVRPENPSPGDLAGEEGRSIYDLMPPGIGWSLLMAGVAVVLVAFWRGRRLGPVVVERLPVVVRAAETVEGRGRLYRARKARERAAGALRAGALDRLIPRLGLGRGANGHEVVAAIAAGTDEDPRQVGDALYGPPPENDEGLVALAGYVDHIERKVSEL
ncbi:DUF4350 domain-containing protein [Nonomuraea sp. MCN248]|uniref:DUF4350 domain-containing protein n=1 Tax=Nonomuraea corallina TaxID=2989783 RepID=A0ABT4S6X9_9ACTN|nr:DUF4350 domain-containing protein [Nonomuraea corallina]MDA0632808.1 DUF4350 domain-containing protein [Nonomuraea corallina]